MKINDFFNKKWLNRFQVLNTKNGFMPFDHDCDEYLYDENGDNSFDCYSDALKLIDDAIIAVLEHKEEV